MSGQDVWAVDQEKVDPIGAQPPERRLAGRDERVSGGVVGQAGLDPRLGDELQPVAQARRGGEGLA
jgi:hypothetical protein